MYFNLNHPIGVTAFRSKGYYYIELLFSNTYFGIEPYIYILFHHLFSLFFYMHNNISMYLFKQEKGVALIRRLPFQLFYLLYLFLIIYIHSLFIYLMSKPNRSNCQMCICYLLVWFKVILICS